MYVLLLGLLFGLGCLALSKSFVSERRLTKALGYLLLLTGVSLLIAMDFSAELFWFQSLGFSDRFWIFFITQVGLCAVAGALSATIMLLVTRGAGRSLRQIAVTFSALTGVVWALSSWQELLLCLNQVASGVVDPIFGIDTGFYLFVLPFLDRLFWLGLILSVVGLVTVLLFRVEDGLFKLPEHLAVPASRLLIPGASLFFAVILAYGALLSLFHLLYSEQGVVMGPGWTDIYVRIPALVLMGLVLIGAGVLPFSHRFRTWMGGLSRKSRLPLPVNLAATLGAWVAIGVSWCVLVLALPAMIQWLVVKPNEITFEAPYIAHNIAFTRAAFKLDEIEERQFAAEAVLDRKVMTENKHLLSEVRLWDLQALDAVYKQFQEIRLYYEFLDVDIDRYQIGDRYRQVMVAARELAKRNLPERSRTFVNERFKYTHGYGITLAPVSDFTHEGLPNLLIKNIPPVAEDPSLTITRPEIYYGELTDDPVVVNSTEMEFDYPSGEKNVYSYYKGEGGVSLGSWWRKFLFGWKFDGTVFLLSTYITRDSRVMFHRQVRERVRKIAPFLEFDEDPYIVLADGRLKWLVDAYTTSSYYPYSQPFDSKEHFGYRNGSAVQARNRTVHQLDGKNYVRNSVKAVVDAYDGDVELFVFDESDPVIASWRKILPGVFQTRNDMPATLRRHVRYPQDFLLVQGLTLTRYHMTDPEVFYNQEDLWVRATEKHYHEVRPVEPYYVMWQLPGSDHAEFVLMLPFTPKNRQVLIGWIAALSDGENYGRFIAYKFPKEKRVLGPQQVETKIDQDAFLSGQLTLWDQQGSEVIRGNVLAIPIDDSLLYVEPIYLRAETSAYPELRMVAVMHGDKLSYAETFEEAMLGLFGHTATELAGEVSASELAVRAQQAFDSYLKLHGNGEFERAAEALRTLSELLNRLKNTLPDPAG